MLQYYFLACTLCSVILAQDPEGHNQPLGSHLSPLGITWIGKFSSPGVFFHHFVKKGEPLVMKGAMLNNPFPASHKWNDDYLRKEFGSQIVSVEQSKKEKRNRVPEKMPFFQFLDMYKKDNIYLVDSLPEKMRDDILLPYTLQYGGFQNVLQDSVLWMSSGGTKSVLHYDKLDNLLCVLNGTKTVVLINKTFKSKVEADGFVQDGTYSKVDVDSVNLKQYPKLKSVPWHRAFLRPGDCLFIPFRWYHHIRSSGGDEDRNLAVNFWFSHLWWHNTANCSEPEKYRMEPLSKFVFASPNEQLRSEILEPFSVLEKVTKNDFADAFLADGDLVDKFYNFINSGEKDVLTWEDLYSFNIDEAVQKFPDIFAAGVKLDVFKDREIPEAEIVEQVQDDFGPESEVIDVPMFHPSSEEFKKIMESLPNLDLAPDPRHEDKPMIKNMNVKVTPKNDKVSSSSSDPSGESKKSSGNKSGEGKKSSRNQSGDSKMTSSSADQSDAVKKTRTSEQSEESEKTSSSSSSPPSKSKPKHDEF